MLRFTINISKTIFIPKIEKEHCCIPDVRALKEAYIKERISVTVKKKTFLYFLNPSLLKTNDCCLNLSQWNIENKPKNNTKHKYTMTLKQR